MTDRSTPKRILLSIVGAVFVIAGMIRAARNERTPEEQERLAKLQARDDERDAQRRREYDQRTLARHSALTYFGDAGKGRRLLDAATVTTIPLGDPFPDAPPRGPRHVERVSSVSSAVANAALTLSLDARDGMGEISFRQGGSVRFEKQFGHHPYRDSKYLHLEGDDLEMFKIMARLLASLGRGFDGIRVRRSDWQIVREQLWERHLEGNPVLAEKIGWTGSGPYTYL